MNQNVLIKLLRTIVFLIANIKNRKEEGKYIFLQLIQGSPSKFCNIESESKKRPAV